MDGNRYPFEPQQRPDIPVPGPDFIQQYGEMKPGQGMTPYFFMEEGPGRYDTSGQGFGGCSAPGPQRNVISYGYVPPNGIPPVQSGNGGGIFPQMPLQTGQKERNAAVWIILGMAGVLLVAFVLLAGSALWKMRRSKTEETDRFRRHTEASDFWTEEDEPKRDRAEKEDGPQAREYEQDMDGVYGTTPDADYYSGLTDSINITTDYQIEWEEYTFEDPDTNAEIYATYPKLTGEEIPNLDVLNEGLESYAMSVMDFYSDYYLESAGADDYLLASALVYVTYNDESSVSVVVAESIEMTDANHRYLCCLNLDLINGIFVWNTEQIEIDEAFLKEFRKQVALQNGWNMEFSDQELFEYLSAEDSLILYYTPVGLEVGINYLNDYNEISWVTATIKDYRRFSRSVG